MTYQIIDGKKISEDIKNELKDRTIELVKKTGETPTLAVVLVGTNPASQVYVGNKKKACEYIGIKSMSYDMDESTTQAELFELIDSLNENDHVNGILVQLPLPAHINEEEVLLRIHPEKDVDCFHPYNVGLLNIGNPNFKPCTPAGIIELIKRSSISIEGKNCVVIGRSNIVGKPVAALLTAENATVTLCHSKTKNLKELCQAADILIAALGRPKAITADLLKEGAVVIDVGIHRLDNKKLCGDVDYENAKEKAGYITPVPGGVGPMTIAMLMVNCLKAFEKKWRSVLNA